ncbi:MAG: ABC transporter ATP-binding protein [Siculibacillus sp.]|nr:ABC transporter ATP-binding protein [Siculibacillus sp.]
MTRIRIEGVGKRFATTTALDDVTLDLPSGSFTALLGASGCGKTTLLRLVAGFEQPSAGRILFDDEVVCDARRQTPPETRNVGVVFQSYALWPHLSVAENVAYPLRTRRVPRAERARRVAEALAAVGLDEAAERSPDALSGGQRQRVALARCMVAEARIIVFDEPLANLDVHLRAALVESFRDLHRRTGTTIVYVTHDQGEALALADRIAVLHAGRVMQFATPRDLYAAPRCRLVAEFVGRGRLVSALAGPAGPGHVRVTIAGSTVAARTDGTAAGAVTVLIRPEALSLADDGLPATVLRTTYRGPVHEVEVRVGASDETLVLDVAGEPPPVGGAVRIAVADAWIVPRD